MRDLHENDAGWLGVLLEVRRRLRTDPVFAASWAERQVAISLVSSRAAGLSSTHLDGVLDLVEDAVRRPPPDRPTSTPATGASTPGPAPTGTPPDDAAPTPTSVPGREYATSTRSPHDQ